MEKSTHTPEYAALREELLSARSKAALSQRQLADRLAVSHSWVAKVESGERRVDLIEFCWIMLACDGDPHAAFKRLLAKVDKKNHPKDRR
jgi:transcriptional regulator with XRE-family HTH domain